jgi:hypothetical protein
MNAGKRLAQIVLLWAFPAVGIAGEDVTAGNTLAMGGAAAAHPEDVAAFTVNPGTIGLAERYDFAGTAAVAWSTGWEAGLGAVDSTLPVAAGAWYRYRSWTEAWDDEDLPGWAPDGDIPENHVREHMVVVGVGVPLLDRRLSLGLDGALLWQELGTGARSTLGNLDIGAAASLRGWTLGLAGRNVLPLGHRDDLPASLILGGRSPEESPLGAALEAQFLLTGTYGMSLRIDDQGNPVSVHSSDAPLIFAGGLEYRYQSFRARAGWRWDGPEGRHTLGFGLGGENTSGGIDYTLLVPVGEPFDAGLLVNQLSLRIST